MPNREKIAVDIDDVALHYSRGFTKFSNRVGWTDDMKPSEYTEQWGKLWGTDDVGEITRRTKVMNRGMNPFLRPVRDSQLALAAIAKTRELVILTSRPKSIHEITQASIRGHFPGLFSAIHYLEGGWGDKGASSATKGETAARLGASVLIDDQPRHAGSMAEVGGTGLLFGENQQIAGVPEKDGLIKTPTWRDVLAALDIDPDSVFGDC